MLRTSGAADPVATAVAACRAAAVAWSAVPIRARLRIVRRARERMARDAASLAAAVSHRPVRDTLVCEVLPLLDGMRFLERQAEQILATRTLRGGRPLWLLGVSAAIERRPLGVVLILGPGNYPLFLPGVQALQALVAGNGVCLKPAPGGEAAADAVAAHLTAAGLPADMLRLLPAASGEAAVTCGVDRIVLTGSAQTGIEVLRASASHLTPCTLELSGCDAAFVMAGADIDRAAQCLAYGLRLNAGATCIAPRRVFVLADMASELEQALVARLRSIDSGAVPVRVAQRLAQLLGRAERVGARVARVGADRPVLVADARADMELLQSDVFAAWLAIVAVPDMAAALEANRRCPYALGASIFGPLAEARRLAQRVPAGSICINDVIVPTADPRLPFGGSGRSGYGRTRGAEGLLEMTCATAVSIRRGRLLPHLAAPDPGDERRFAGLIRVLHGGWWVRPDG